MLRGHCKSLDAKRPCFGSSTQNCAISGQKLRHSVKVNASAHQDEAPKRVVVTGLGVVSCLGQDHETFYNNLLEGKSGISPIQHFAASDWSTNFAGEIRGLETEGYLTKKLARRIDDVIKYTIISGKKALGDAGLPWDGNELSDLDKARCGIMIGKAQATQPIASHCNSVVFMDVSNAISVSAHLAAAVTAITVCQWQQTC